VLNLQSSVKEKIKDCGRQKEYGNRKIGKWGNGEMGEWDYLTILLLLYFAVSSGIKSQK
jgi:hypothetical protein